MRISLRIPIERFSDRWFNVEINWKPGVPAGVEKRFIRPKDSIQFQRIVAFGDALDGAWRIFRQASRTNGHARNHERRLVTREVYKRRGLATLPELHALVV
jgi:hypothetical protein